MKSYAGNAGEHICLWSSGLKTFEEKNIEVNNVNLRYCNLPIIRVEHFLIFFKKSPPFHPQKSNFKAL